MLHLNHFIPLAPLDHASHLCGAHTHVHAHMHNHTHYGMGKKMNCCKFDDDNINKEARIPSTGTNKQGIF